MHGEQGDHFDVDVIEAGIGRTRRFQVERNHQLGAPRWRIFVSDDPTAIGKRDELAELIRLQTIELRRVADRLEDLAALMVTGRGAVIDRELVSLTPADVGKLEDVRS